MIDRLYVPSLPRSFVAIDFETATRDPDSACQIGMVKVVNREIVKVECRLIKPPPPYLKFAPIHGITWEQVQDQPKFGEVWKELRGLLEGACFIAAHNAPFDRGVLYECCDRAKLAPPGLGWECSMKLSQRTWSIGKRGLADVCEALGIPLAKQHDAGEDALACAKIILAAIA